MRLRYVTIPSALCRKDKIQVLEQLRQTHPWQRMMPHCEKLGRNGWVRYLLKYPDDTPFILNSGPQG